MAQLQCALIARRMQSDRMTSTDVGINTPDDLDRIIEITRSIDRQDRTQLLAGKWILGSSVALLDH